MVVLALMSSPVAAQELIDYDLLLQQNADRVAVTTDTAGGETRTLDMPGGVIVSCSDQGCVGMDMGAAGAVGCVWSLAMALRAVAQVCAMPDATQSELNRVHSRLTAFAAENAIPPREVAELDGYYDDLVQRYREGGQGAGPVVCESVVAPGSDVLAMIEAVVSGPSPDGTGFDVDALLATPRLPVMNPCF